MNSKPAKLKRIRCTFLKKGNRQSDQAKRQKNKKHRIVDENTGDNSQTNVLVPHISKITNPVNRLKRSQKQRKTKLLNCFIEPIEMVNLENNN